MRLYRFRVLTVGQDVQQIVVRQEVKSWKYESFRLEIILKL